MTRNSTSINQVIGLFIITGMMGGLSTFSTFSVETVDLFYKSNYIFYIINILENLILSLGSVILCIQRSKFFCTVKTKKV